jgi:hypothetical protein
MDHLRWALFEAERMEALRRRMVFVPFEDPDVDHREYLAAKRLVMVCEANAGYDKQYAFFDFLPVVHDKRLLIFADVPKVGGIMTMGAWYDAHKEVILPAIDEAHALTHEENRTAHDFLDKVHEYVTSAMHAYEVKYVR